MSWVIIKPDYETKDVPVSSSTKAADQWVMDAYVDRNEHGNIFFRFSVESPKLNSGYKSIRSYH